MISAKRTSMNAAKKERAVIDEGLIRQSVLEDRAAERESNAPTSGAGALPDDEEGRVDFEDVRSLVLSFKNVVRIENLQGFEGLTRLQLDNNFLERIENLGHLVNLEWLDISFNKISRIEGLEKLVRLKDLSLFHNQISKLQGLETLTQLQILSIGHNQIAALEDIHSLRQFKRLNCLIMKENPVCKDENYLVTVFAYLKHLKYLDYELVSSTAVKSAREEKHEELQEVYERERVQDLADEAAEAAAKKRVIAEEANLAGVETLFDDMLKVDVEYLKLEKLPGFSDIVDSFREQFLDATRVFVIRVMDRFAVKQSELKQFNAAMASLKELCERDSIAIIDEFSKAKKKCFAALERDAVHGQADLSALDALRDKLQEMTDALMDIEVSQVERVIALTNDLFYALQEQQNECAKQIAEYCSRLLDLEKMYYESAQSVTNKLVEKHMAGKLMQAFEDAGVNTDWKYILEDREQLNTAVNGSHEKHEELMNKLEGRLTDNETTYAERMLTKYRDADYTRNRQRVSEILNMVERHKSDMDRLVALNAAASASAKDEDLS